MGVNRWQCNPIDVVQIPEGKLTTIDNTRVLSAGQVEHQLFRLGAGIIGPK